MRKYLTLLVALTCISAPTLAAQQTPSTAPSWSRVQSLPPGTKIRVKAKHGGGACIVTTVDAASLSCSHGSPARTDVFLLADIKSVKVPRRAKSTLIGMGIGVAGGAGIGAAIGRNGSFVPRGVAAVIIAIPGAIIGALVGAGTDFAGEAIYKGN